MQLTPTPAIIRSQENRSPHVFRRTVRSESQNMKKNIARKVTAPSPQQKVQIGERKAAAADRAAVAAKAEHRRQKAILKRAKKSVKQARAKLKQAKKKAARLHDSLQAAIKTAAKGAKRLANQLRKSRSSSRTRTRRVKSTREASGKEANRSARSRHRRRRSRRTENKVALPGTSSGVGGPGTAQISRKRAPTLRSQRSAGDPQGGGDELSRQEREHQDRHEQPVVPPGETAPQL